MLLRTGRKRDAVQLLEVLLKEQPKNDDVRAVLISALIETGAVGKAQSILDSIEGISLGG